MTNPASTSPSQAPTYPPADRDDVVESLHGVEVADPYRYLEDPDAERTATFVAAQNAVSEPLLEALPGRPRFHELTTALVTAPRAGVPWERGGRYFVVSNPGERDQDVLYTAPSASALLDDPDGAAGSQRPVCGRNRRVDVRVGQRRRIPTGLCPVGGRVGLAHHPDP